MKILFVCVLFFSQNVFAEQFSIVVNEKNPVSGDIKRYYLLKKEKWPNRSSVEPYDIAVNDDLEIAVARNVFIRKELGFSSASAYLEYWIRQKSKGRTKKPQALGSYQDVLRFVKNERGGVGFVPSRLAEGVRVIKTFEL